MKAQPHHLGNEKINKLLFRLSMPATIGMLVMALYNIIDTIFVGQGVGAVAIGGLAIVFPIQMLINSVALTIGIGGASIISRALGAGKKEYADNTFGNLLSLVIILSLLLTPAVYFFSDIILKIFGAKGEILSYATDYFSIVLWGGPFVSFAMMGNNIIRSEGNAKVAMQTMLVGAIVNLILDPILIFGLEMGIKGAAWATFISHISAASFVLFYFSSGRSSLRIHMKYFRLNLLIVKETLAIGVSSFTRNAANSMMAVILNHSLMHYGGEMTVAIFGIIHRILMFILMPIFGVLQGFLPIAGYNYGSGNFKRLRDVIKLSHISTTIIGIAGFIILFIFTEQIIRLFTNEKEIIEGGKFALRFIIITFPLLGIQVICAGFFQALGKVIPSFFLSLSRQVLFLIPLVLIMPLFFNIRGIWLSFPMADILSFFVSLSLFLFHFKKIRAQEAMSSASIQS
jgi:putative MATE family efflux protein